jgi:excisionase family DNA binding protein
MHLGGFPDLSLVVADPRRVADLRTVDIPALLGALEQVRAALWSHMLRTPAPVARESDDTVGDQLLTVADVAAEVRFTPGYVYEAIRRGQLSAVRKGKYVRIRRAQLRAWLDGFPANGLDPRPAHPDSRPPMVLAPTGRRGIRPRSRASRAARGGAAHAVTRNHPATEQAHE